MRIEALKVCLLPNNSKYLMNVDKRLIIISIYRNYIYVNFLTGLSRSKNPNMIKRTNRRLRKACANGNAKIVKDILENDYHFNEPGTSDGYSFLYLALKEKRKEVAKLLLKYGAKVNTKTMRRTYSSVPFRPWR